MIWWCLAMLVIVGFVLAGCKVTRSGCKSAPYRVVRADGKFQVRDYPALTIVETAMTGSRNGEDGSFMRLFRFIQKSLRSRVGATSKCHRQGGCSNPSSPKSG